MKNLILIFLLLGSVVSLGNVNKHHKIESTTKKVAIECRFGQCQATAKSTGKQCKHCVSNSGDKFCYQHK